MRGTAVSQESSLIVSNDAIGTGSRVFLTFSEWACILG
jgi:hypothetical protein